MVEQARASTSRAEMAPLVVVWAAGAVLTAVGMYSVARACGMPWYLAWGYPAIFDGLGVVSFGATSRIRPGLGRSYAWLVVAICTGLSAAAQAAHLAAGDGLSGSASPTLRIAVGASAAPAVAIAAHLHWLVTRAPTEPAVLSSVGPTTESTAAAGPGRDAPTQDTSPARPPALSADTQDGTQDGARKTAVSAATRTPRALVSVPADSTPGQRADTPRTAPPDSTPDSRTDTSQDTDRLSSALLSGLSIRVAAEQTGQPKSAAEKRRAELVRAGQLEGRA